MNEPRVYPCRGGETLEDIINPRKISRGGGRKRLNPKLGALKAGGSGHCFLEGKYTVREKEMLQRAASYPSKR